MKSDCEVKRGVGVRTLYVKLVCVVCYNHPLKFMSNAGYRNGIATASSVLFHGDEACPIGRLTLRRKLKNA